MLKITISPHLVSYVVFNVNDINIHYNYGGRYLGFETQYDEGPTRIVRYLLPDDIGIRVPCHLPTQMLPEDLGL